MLTQKTNWKDDNIIHFIINKVKSEEFVWNPQHYGYKNIAKKHLFWNTLVGELKKEFPQNGTFNYSELAKKWNNLKTYFCVEYQKQFCRNSESLTDNAEESTWKFYPSLIFLKGIYEGIGQSEIDNNQSSLNVNNKKDLYIDSAEEATASHNVPEEFRFRPISISKRENNSLDENSISIRTNLVNPLCRPTSISSTSSSSESESQHVDRVSPPRTKKARINTTTKEDETCLKASQNLLCVSKPQRKQQVFGDYVAHELENLDADLVNQAKLRISTVLFECNDMQIERNKNLPTD